MDQRAERFERLFQWPVIVASLLVIPTIALEASSAGPPWSTVAEVLNWTTWFVFALELAVMLAVVPRRGEWLRSHPLEVVIVFLTPPILPASLQTLRVLRLLRLVPGVRFARHLFSLEGLRYAALIAFLAAVGGGTAFASIENVSTWHGIYWSVATMTTTGYGDIYPRTDAGQVLALAVMIVGIGFATIVIGAVAQRFVAGGFEAEIEELEEAEPGAEAAEAELVRELRAMADRLGELETLVLRLREAPR